MWSNLSKRFKIGIVAISLVIAAGFFAPLTKRDIILLLIGTLGGVIAGIIIGRDPYSEDSVEL